MKALVSIVTPCYNGEKYLERFLDSVINQTYPFIELILINDGSTDETKKVIERYRPKFTVRGIGFIVQFQKNAGQAAALNRGLKLFTGDYLLWADSDDVLSNNFVETRVNFLRMHKEFAYCGGKVIFVSENNPKKILNVLEKRTNDEENTFFEDVLYVRNVFFAGYMCRTAALDKVIPNREIYAGLGGQNAQLLLPLSWYYGEPGYVEESYYKYYIRQNSHSHSRRSSEQIIQQLENYEDILIETIKRMADKKAWKYIDSIQQYYARLKFGNAVDTKNSDLIKKYYKILKSKKTNTIKDIALYIKYTGIIGKIVTKKR